MRQLLPLVVVCLLPALAWAQPTRSLDPETPVVETVDAGPGAPWAPSDARRSASTAVSMATAFEHDVISQMRVSADGTRLVSSGALSGTVVSQDPVGGERQWAASLGGDVLGLGVAGAVVVAAVSDPAEAVVLDLATGQVLRRVTLSGTPVRVALSADGSQAAVGLLDNQIALVDVAAGTLQRVVDVPFRATLNGRFFRSNRRYSEYTPFGLTEDGSRLVVGANDEARTYATATGALVASSPLPATAYGLDVSEVGVAAFVTGFQATSGRTLVLYDIESGSITSSPLGQAARSSQVVMRADGTAAVVLIGTNAVAVTPGGSPARVILGQADALQRIGGGRAATWGLGAMRRIDLAGLTVDATVSLSSSLGYESASLLSGGGNGEVVSWSFWFERARTVDFSTSTQTGFDLGGSPGLDAPRRLALSPSGDRVAVSHIASGRIAVVDVVTREIVQEFSAGMRFPEALAFLSADELVVVGNDRVQADPVVSRIDSRTGGLLQQVETGQVDAGAVFVRGSRVFVHSRRSQRLDVFEASSGELVLDQSHRSGGVPEYTVLSVTPFYIGVSPTGHHSVGVDSEGSGEIIVVDLETGVRTAIPADINVDQIAFSADGLRAGLTSFDGSFYLIGLDGAPSLLTTTQLPSETSAVTYDASSDRFVAATAFDAPGVLFDVDARTGAFLGQATLPNDFLPHALLWSAPTGVVVTGDWRLPTGFIGGGAVYSAVGYEQFAGEAGETVLVPSRGEAIVAVPERDVLEIVQASPVGAESAPADAAHRLSVLSNPSSAGVRVRLDGAPSAALRVEVVDVLGRVLTRLHDGPFAGGARDLVWAEAPTGSYLVRVVGTGTVARASVVR